jgi:hypothetical protein
MTDGMLARLNRHQVASYDNREVIDELEGLGVPATMFLAGKWIERYPDETRRLAANPLFELASHSYAHRAFHTPCYGLPAIGQAGMAADVERSEGLLAQFTDHPTRYFRFPGGCYDSRSLQAIASAGVVVIQFDVASGDAFGHSVPAIVRHVLGSVRNGSIVVMHITDGDTAPLTARALPPVVEGLRARGYELVRVSTLLSAVKSTRAEGEGVSGLPTGQAESRSAQQQLKREAFFGLKASPERLRIDRRPEGALVHGPIHCISPRCSASARRRPSAMRRPPARSSRRRSSSPPGSARMTTRE